MSKKTAPIDFFSSRFLILVLRRLLVLGPLVTGVLHQFLMLFFGIRAIYVFVPVNPTADPPNYIYPLVALDWQWWILLVFTVAVLSYAAYAARRENLTTRFFVPMYLYLLFLLIFVEPK
jgi:hypothetical protein